MVKIEDVEKMKVADLRQELTTRGLPTDGKKQDLVARLKQHLKEKDEGDDVDEAVKAAEEALAEASKDDEGKVESNEQNETTPSEASKTEGQAVKNGDEGEQKSKPASADDVLLPEYEERKKRAERFGLPVPEMTADEKKKLRALRFQLQEAAKKGSSEPTNTASTTAVLGAKKLSPEERKKQIEEEKKRKAEQEAARLEKKKQRALRFGEIVKGGQSIVLSEEEKEKMKKRMERFGTAV